MNVEPSFSNITILHPENGGVYESANIKIRISIDNKDGDPYSVVYQLGNAPSQPIPRLNTDWFTYMQNDYHNGYSKSVAPKDANILWKSPVTGYFHEFCSPVIVNGIVYYVSDEESTVFANDAETGSILWSYNVIDHVDDAVTVKYDKVYISADSAWCLDAYTGQRIWAYGGSNDYCMTGTPAVDNGIAYFNNIYYLKDVLSFQALSIDAETGQLIWSKYFDGYMGGSITIWRDFILIPVYEGSLYCLNKYSGEIVWENTDSDGGYWDTSPAIKDSLIYIGGKDGNLHAYNIFDGTTVWESYIGGSVESTPAIKDDIIYAGYTTYDANTKGLLCAIDRNNGYILWSKNTNLHGSVGIAENIIYWGEHYSNSIKAANALTGNTIWSYEMQAGSHGIQSSPAIVNGVMYIAGTDGYLYAFGSGIKYCYEDSIVASAGENELKVSAWDLEGNIIGKDTITFTIGLMGIEPITKIIDYKLLQNYPNPFNPITRIKFGILEQSDVKIIIYDILGKEVNQWTISNQAPGWHEVIWNGINNYQQKVATGIYIYQMIVGDNIETRKMVLMK